MDSYYNITHLIGMDSMLIYDIQSEVASQNGEEPIKSINWPKKQEKQTEISDVPQARVIQVRPSFLDQQPLRKPKEEMKEHENIIFYDDDLGKSTSSLDIDETNRCFLKNQQDDSDDDSSENYDEVEQLEELVEVTEEGEQTEKERAIVPQQIKLNNQTVVVRANVQLFVKQIVPLNYRITCVIQVERNMLGLPSCYRLFLHQPHQFLLAAKKEVFKYYSNFIISKHPNEIHKRSKIYMGRMQGNFIGTEYQLFSYQEHYQNLIMTVSYEKNIIGFNGPRSSKVTKLNPEVKAKLKNNLAAVLERNEKSKLLELATAKPILKKGKYRLDFGGKVKLPSAKNFILQDIKSSKRNLLFGKIQTNRYILQISYPLTIFQAFGVCLTSLDSKLMVN